MKAYGKVEVELHSFLNLALDGHRLFTPVRTPDTHWIQGWVHLRENLEVRSEVSYPCQESNTKSSSP